MPTFRLLQKPDLHRVNMLLSRAFSQARLDDGYSNTHVPMCQHDFLDMYYEENPQGCFILEENKKILAALFSHVWGKTGWLGPIAVVPEKHLQGYGKRITQLGIEFLKRSGCTTIGLETNPKSSRNMAFYYKLGFYPQSLTFDLIRKVENSKDVPADFKVIRYSKCTGNDEKVFLEKCRMLVQSVNPDVDYTPLITSTKNHKYADSLLITQNGKMLAYTSLQTTPATSEETPGIMRMINLVAHPTLDSSFFMNALPLFEQIANSYNLRQFVVRIPSIYSVLIKTLLDNGFRIIHSDTKMVLTDFEEKPVDAFNFCRWV